MSKQMMLMMRLFVLVCVCACVCLLVPNNVMIPAIIYKFQIRLILNVSNAWHKIYIYFILMPSLIFNFFSVV